MPDTPDGGGALARIDLPIRDVLRFIGPGGYGAISAALLDHYLFADRLGIAHTSMLVPVGFVFGLIAFIGEFHTRFWPWKRQWVRELEAIATEINAITGSKLARREEFAKPIYKLWIEAVCPPSLRGYLHYTTGLYYSTAAVSVYSVASSFVSISYLMANAAIYIVGAGIPGLKLFILNEECGIAAACAGGFLVVALLSYRMSKSCLKGVAIEGRISMELDASRDELVRLARAATRTSADIDDTIVVSEVAKNVLREVCPADLDGFQSARCDQVVEQFDARSGNICRVAHITVTSKVPAAFNGGRNLYVGEQQRIVESALAMQLCGRLNVDSIRLQFGPIDDFWKTGYRPQKKRISVVRLETALDLGIVAKESPIVQCCREYGIAKLFIRGRFVLGPSPGLAAVLKQELPKLTSGVRVFDAFAGTRLVDRICKRFDPTAQVVSQDRLDLDGNGSECDSFCTAIPSEPYDLVIVDPLYEDCLPYLALVGNLIKTKKLIVQSGRSCDIGWNARVEAMLQTLGTVEKPVVDTYGSSIFVVTRSWNNLP